MKTVNLRLWLLALMILSGCASTSEDDEVGPRLETTQIGEVERAHRLGGYYLTSQPSIPDMREAHEVRGVKTILNLRLPEESIGEGKAALGLGLRYENVPFRAPDTLSDWVFEEARAILRAHEESSILVHCKSGNRVGSIWFAFRALDMGLSSEAALAEAKIVGLKKPGHIKRCQEYVDGELAKRK